MTYMGGEDTFPDGEKGRGSLRVLTARANAQAWKQAYVASTF